MPRHTHNRVAMSDRPVERTPVISVLLQSARWRGPPPHSQHLTLFSGKPAGRSYPAGYSDCRLGAKPGLPGQWNSASGGPSREEVRRAAGASAVSREGTLAALEAQARHVPA